MRPAAARRFVAMALAVAALEVQAQTDFGSLGDPLHGLRAVVDTYSHAEGGTRVTSRYVVRQGHLAGPLPKRRLLVEQQRVCAAGRPGAAVLPEAAFPQKVAAVRQEDYLSEEAQLSVRTTAHFTLSAADCSIRWEIKRTGTLSRKGTRGVCKLDYEHRTYAGNCDVSGRAHLVEPPASRPGGEAPSQVKALAGHSCHVVSNPMIDTPATPEGSACVWTIEPAQRAQFPGLLSRNLFLELDYGRDNGQVTATQAQSSRQLDARMFAVPAGFTQRNRR